jgi:hypothetical protein
MATLGNHQIGKSLDDLRHVKGETRLLKLFDGLLRE